LVETTGAFHIQYLIIFVDAMSMYGLTCGCRGDIPLTVSEQFVAKLNELEDVNRASPVILDDHVTFTYIQYSNLYLLALSRTNSNAAAIVAFLHKIVEIFKHYFREVRAV
jgi:AP-1 complex subunit mu